MKIEGYDLLQNGTEGIRYAWKLDSITNYVESAAFVNRTKGKDENICGYTTSVSSGCILKAYGMQCYFCRTGNNLNFGRLLTYKEIAKQNIFMVLTDMYCNEHTEIQNKTREFAYMGQGEPGLSYSQVRKAIELTNRAMKKLDQKVYRHIFATCGIPEAIDNYCRDVKDYYTERVTLHLSLHGTVDRELIMPIDKIYPYKSCLDRLRDVYEVTNEKTCIGILLLNKFTPSGRTYSYTNSVANIETIINELDPNICRLSLCEYNASPDVGTIEIYDSIEARNLLNEVKKRGFEAKMFSSFGREKNTACGMLGSKTPDQKVSQKWKELEKYTDELIEEMDNE